MDMNTGHYVRHVLLGATAAAFFGAPYFPGLDRNGPVLDATMAIVRAKPHPADTARSRFPSQAAVTEVAAALNAFQPLVVRLSHPRALEEAFSGYFAYKAAHPDDVRKPFLYFVDYGLPSTSPRGYVFDMASRTIVEGPFTVAHGRGSSSGKDGVPTTFSNRPGSAATSLGLYLAQETYGFNGKTAGRHYSSIGLRLMGLSGDYNDNARARRVVAHGAPYVTASKAGRSEGCPAMEPSRASRLLPKLANGGLVFLFAPREDWMASDPWLARASGHANTSVGAG
ncbi:MAG TPA: murein L,D-transpeptidase catalytic domain family protein [Gemmatimonadaceae bacterium]|nr:murein L,D-transpeptidase catalytic domain family protein [Gemmatimonadaceae bacterium]